MLCLANVVYFCLLQKKMELGRNVVTDLFSMDIINCNSTTTTYPILKYNIYKTADNEYKYILDICNISYFLFLLNLSK